MPLEWLTGCCGQVCREWRAHTELLSGQITECDQRLQEQMAGQAAAQSALTERAVGGAVGRIDGATESLRSQIVTEVQLVKDNLHTTVTLAAQQTTSTTDARVGLLETQTMEWVNAMR